jgi:predicted protein tyrosine phosphatase
LVISITTPKLPLAKLPDSEFCRGVLRLSFDDTSDDDTSAHRQSLREIILFTEADAEAILTFVQDYLEEITLIVCHCEAGVSRSPAVAAALSCLLTGDDKTFFAFYHPNRFVYRLLLRVAEAKYPDFPSREF